MVRRVQPISTILVKSQSSVVAHTKLSKYQSWKSNQNTMKVLIRLSVNLCLKFPITLVNIRLWGTRLQIRFLKCHLNT